jgi:aconitate hydratase
MEGDNYLSLGLDGTEIYSIPGLTDAIKPAQKLTVNAVGSDGNTKSFQVLSRLDSKIEIDYYRNSGILQYMLRQFLKKKA